MQFVVFFIGAILYFLVNKSCCKMVSTNFRIAIALTSTIGVAIILLTILHAIEVSVNDTLPAVSTALMIEQLFLFLLFVSSSKVRKSLKKMFVYKKRSSTSPIQSKEEHRFSEVYNELHIPMVAVL